MHSKLLGAYFAAPVWMQNILISAYGARLRRARYGSMQRAFLADLLRSQWFSPEQLRELQLRRLNDILQIARGVPLYRERLPTTRVDSLEDLRRLPILRKDDLRGPRDQLISPTVPHRAIHEIHTGGTTGTPLTVYCDRSALQRNYAFFSRLLAWAGICPGTRTATFAGRTVVPPNQSAPPYWRRNYAASTLLFSSYHISAATIPAYVRELASFQPELIDSYPSSIVPIARYILQNGIDTIRPRAIVTSSETLDPTSRKLISTAFGAPVFDYYGGAEMAAFVTQCEQGEYHVNPEYGIVEILTEGAPAPPGELGEIIATGFVNGVMPVIRYATGDLASWGDKPCKCGRAFPVISRIEGRRDDIIVTPEGRRVGRLDPVFKAVTQIHEAQIVQDAPDHVTAKIVAEDLPKSQLDALTAELKLRLGPSMRVEVVFVGSIPRTRGGKFRAVVNLCHRHQD